MSVLRQRFKDLAARFVTQTFADFTNTFVISSLTRTPDNQGGFTTFWNDLHTVTGFVFPEPMGEKEFDTYLKTDTMKVFIFRYIAGLNNSMRIRYQSKLYNIRKIESLVDVDIWIKITAEEQVAT